MTHTVRNAALPRLLLLLAGVALLLAGCGTADPGAATAARATVSTTESPAAGPGERDCEIGQALDQCPTKKASPAITTTPITTPPGQPAAKPPTVAQQQALQAAQSYLEFGGMSRAGLIRQLTAKAGDGFSKADATWAVDHLAADWNAEAVESAKAYLEMGGMSRAGLLQQLTSKYGDGFTKAQAQYAVKKIGL